MTRKLVSYRLDDDLIQDLKKQADADGITVTELVNRLLRQSLQIGRSSMEKRLAALEESLQKLEQKINSDRNAYTGRLTQPEQILATSITNSLSEERLASLEESLRRLTAEITAERQESRRKFDLLLDALEHDAHLRSGEEMEKEKRGKLLTQSIHQESEPNPMNSLLAKEMLESMHSDDCTRSP
jgi:plasmid stability protein